MNNIVTKAQNPEAVEGYLLIQTKIDVLSVTRNKHLDSKIHMTKQQMHENIYLFC